MTSTLAGAPRPVAPRAAGPAARLLPKARANGGDELWYHWLPAVDRIIPVPDEYRSPRLDLAEAARELGTTEELLELLVGAGLPAAETADGPRFDYHDIMNLGLSTGLGRSLAELGERQCLRLAAGQPQAWLTERTTRIRLTATCSAPGCDGTPPLPAAPRPEGGRLDGFAADPNEPGSVIATVTTVGAADAPRSETVRRIHDDLLDLLLTGEYQYSWLPDALRERPATAWENRTVDCVIAAWRMREQARAAGLEARTRRGFLLGLVGVEHAWTEVLEDGRWLPLDPVLAFLASRHKASNPDFSRFTCGSFHNRLLAWDRSIEQSLADHTCPHGGRVRVDCRQLPPAPPSSPVGPGAP
ncbi:transglutaminase domain-containing protein [Kitasatospora sp. NPDC093558]|uniref:transglutaminase domain-containing protein n=1 Tax=Kitasatospora sp. NPDC093558 TaxID=3155201 RepID=UPI003438C0B0